MDDYQWMEKALALAKKAAHEGERPIGALIIDDQNQLISSAYNQTIQNIDPCAHAEILAIREACERVGNYRLLNTTLYVTLEPCAMCAGAIIQARIPRVVFGAYDAKAGAVMSVFSMLNHPKLNHHATFTPEVLADESVNLLQAFFKARRVF